MDCDFDKFKSGCNSLKITETLLTDGRSIGESCKHCLMQSTSWPLLIKAKYSSHLSISE